MITWKSKFNDRFMVRALSAMALLTAVSACTGEGSKAGKQNASTDLEAQWSAIDSAILIDQNSFYYTDLSVYSELDPGLSIGVFDSGTGGLTVLDALVRFDQFSNADGAKGADGQADFSKESFIYLADQANMPYGNYYATGKSDLLVEHIIKDAQFLLGNKYYANAAAQAASTDKSAIKAIVIACNTATAYGKEYIDAFMKKAGLDVPVIGVIDAGVRGTLDGLAKDENASIAVFATVGTIASKGYENTILKMKDELGYTGQIQIFNQGGHGVAEAVDEEPDYLDRNAKSPRDNYRGPGLGHEQYPISKELMDIYGFDFSDYQMLCDSENTDDCQILQINSAENYVRYHLVTILEQIRQTPNAHPLKAIVLGCTHYPYLTKEINAVLKELYDLEHEGEYRYRAFMSEHIQLIDPAVYTAKELYEALSSRKLFREAGSMTDSEFYISVPNMHNNSIQVDENQRFTYDYKYGRNAGEIQEYVKVVPFDKSNISEDTMERLRASIPETFKLIVDFHAKSDKLKELDSKLKIQ